MFLHKIREYIDKHGIWIPIFRVRFGGKGVDKPKAENVRFRMSAPITIGPSRKSKRARRRARHK